MPKKNNGSFDTNMLLRLLLDDVPGQTAAVEKLLRPGRTYEVADVALIEMVFVLEKVYEMDRSLIKENVIGIIRNRSFICNSSLFERTMPLYVAEPSLSVVDCTLLTYAQLNSALPLYTFDKKLITVSDGDSVAP